MRECDLKHTDLLSSNATRFMRQRRPLWRDDAASESSPQPSARSERRRRRQRLAGVALCSAPRSTLGPFLPVEPNFEWGLLLGGLQIGEMRPASQILTPAAMSGRLVLANESVDSYSGWFQRAYRVNPTVLESPAQSDQHVGHLRGRALPLTFRPTSINLRAASERVTDWACARCSIAARIAAVSRTTIDEVAFTVGGFPILGFGISSDICITFLVD